MQNLKPFNFIIHQINLAKYEHLGHHKYKLKKEFISYVQIYQKCMLNSKKLNNNFFLK